MSRPVNPGPSSLAGSADAQDSGLSVEARWACVDVPALPLQLLAQHHPDWTDRPMAVIAEDRPRGLILWVNERAYRAHVLPGLRYAAGLSLCHALHAGVVSKAEIDAGVRRLVTLLHQFSPSVEASSTEPGVFWLDASGLVGLEISLDSWARRIRRILGAHDFTAHVAVGFSRFGTYALARTTRGSLVMTTHEQEREGAGQVRLDRLHLAPSARERLAKLGIHTVNELLRLPVDGLARRFGTEVLRLYRRAAGNLSEPLDAQLPDEPVEACIELEHPEVDGLRLAFVIKRVLHTLLPGVARRGCGVAALRLELKLDHDEPVQTEIRTAAPTLQAVQLVDLVRLKLDTLALAAGVIEVLVRIDELPVDSRQLSLFAERSPRDLLAGARAFARIRTQFGDDSVVTARLYSAHLPEASFQWEKLDAPVLPCYREPREHCSVRRIFERPIPLPHRGRHEPDGWLLRGPEQGAMRKIVGPYIVSGGWWVRPVERHYHFVETQTGDLLWVYYDRWRRRWFLHGQVE